MVVVEEVEDLVVAEGVGDTKSLNIQLTGNRLADYGVAGSNPITATSLHYLYSTNLCFNDYCYTTLEIIYFFLN